MERPVGEGLLDGADGSVARVADGFKDELLALAGFAADDAGPGDVVEDAVGLVDATPDIDQQEVAFLDFGGVVGGGLVVRVGAVGVDADVGAVFPDEICALHAVAEPLHHVEFGDFAGLALGGTQAAADFLPGFFEDFVDGLLRDGVAERSASR